MSEGLEVDALRLANAALEEQLISDAHQTELMLQQLEQQRNLLREAHQEQQGLMHFVQRVMDTVGSLVIVLDQTGIITQRNRSVSQTLAGKGDRRGSEVIDEWLHPDDLARLKSQLFLTELPWPIQSVLFETIRFKGNYTREHRLHRSDGGFGWFRVEASMLYDDYGKEEGAVVNATDITSLKELTDHLEERVNESTAELGSAIERLAESEKLATLGGLVAGMAHEINTPIANTLLVSNTLNGEIAEIRNKFSSQAMRRSELESFLFKCEEASRILEKNTRRASELIAGFKHVAVDETSMRRRQFRLSELVEETLHAITPAFKRLPVTINTDIPADLTLDTYPGALEQVVINLITNAMRHAVTEGQALTISIRARLLDLGERVPQQCELNISDDGQGMPPEVAARAFERFFTTKSGRGGSGLGLYLVKSLTRDNLRGEIALHSALGKGTRFVVTIPRMVPEEQDTKGSV